MTSKTVPDRSIRICADRGGTFCDVHASFPDLDNPGERKELVVKLRECSLHSRVQYFPVSSASRAG